MTTQHSELLHAHSHVRSASLQPDNKTKSLKAIKQLRLPSLEDDLYTAFWRGVWLEDEKCGGRAVRDGQAA